MPKRTNPFQSLINLIEFQTASQKARVTESKEFIDAVTGQKREVDIVIETQEGAHQIIIGIECTDRSRPMDETWIEAIYGKHRNLPINKTIVVSRSGFYNPAIIKAKERKIDTLTLDEALATDWKKTTNRLSNLEKMTVEGFHRLSLKGVSFGIIPGHSLPPQLGTIGDTVLYAPDGRNCGNIFDIAQQFLSEPSIEKISEKNAVENPNMNVDIELVIPMLQGSYILDQIGNKYLLGAINIKATCRNEVSTVALKKANYGSSAVLHGDGIFLGHTVQLALVEQANGQLTFGASIREPKKLQPSKDRRRGKRKK
jgi:hypothetical protein